VRRIRPEALPGQAPFAPRNSPCICLPRFCAAGHTQNARRRGVSPLRSSPDARRHSCRPMHDAWRSAVVDRCAAHAIIPALEHQRRAAVPRLSGGGRLHSIRVCVAVSRLAPSPPTCGASPSSARSPGPSLARARHPPPPRTCPANATPTDPPLTGSATSMRLDRSWTSSKLGRCPGHARLGFPIGLRWACDHPCAVTAGDLPTAGSSPNVAGTPGERHAHAPSRAKRSRLSTHGRSSPSAISLGLERERLGTPSRSTVRVFDGEHCRGPPRSDRSATSTSCVPLRGPRRGARPCPTLILWGEDYRFRRLPWRPASTRRSPAPTHVFAEHRDFVEYQPSARRRAGGVPTSAPR